MSRGWRALAGALFILGIEAACAGEDPVQTQPVSHPPDKPQVQSVFHADRLAAAYDRAAQRADHKRSETPAVTAESESSVSSFAAKLVLSLLMVVGAIYGISYLAKYWMGGTLAVAPGPLKVLARHSISSKHSIYLVAALDRFLIIGESPQGLSCLSQFENGEANRNLREQWGWDGSHPREANRLYTPATSPFGPSLKAHVEDLEQELARLREAS